MVYTPRGRVVVTTVTPEGKSIFEEDAAIAIGPLPGASIRRFYNVDQVPVDGPVQTSHVHEEDFNSKKGATFVECEMEPGKKSPFHATPSIDFGVVISGEIVLILDDRAETTLKAGDVYIQKCTNHAWENRSGELARFATVLLSATA